VFDNAARTLVALGGLQLSRFGSDSSPTKK
jgi:hypothetical protein